MLFNLFPQFHSCQDSQRLRVHHLLFNTPCSDALPDILHLLRKKNKEDHHGLQNRVQFLVSLILKSLTQSVAFSFTF